MAEEIQERPDPEIQDPPQDPPPAPLEEPDKEPDGTDGLSVYGRKMNARAKKAEQEAARLREENIRLQERARAVEENKKVQAAPAERVFTAEEIQALVDSGQLKPGIAAAYLARMEVQAALRENDEKQRREAPIIQARSRIAEYVKAIPALGDQTSSEFVKAANEYTELMSQGYPDNDQTRALAIKMAHGDLTMLQKKAAMRDREAPRLPSDQSGGTGNGNKQSDFSHAPNHLQEYWKKAGLKPEEQKRHFERWQAQQKK